MVRARKETGGPMTTLYWLARSFARSVLRTTSSFEVIDADKCLESGGAIIAANHSSYLDPPVVACCYEKKVTFLARSTLFRGFGAWLYPRLNAVPIDRGQADLKSMRGILQRLKEGHRLLIFPEGTRTEDGRLQSAKAGIGMLVAKSGVPVQPVRICGTYESWPKGGTWQPHRITAIIGDPVQFAPEDLAGKSRESYQNIADELMRAIGELRVPQGVAE